jgi:hypothetical protein
MATNNTVPDYLSTDGNVAAAPISAPLSGMEARVAATQNELFKSLFLYEDAEAINVRVLYENGCMTSQFTRYKQQLAKHVAQMDKDRSIMAIFVQLQVIDLPTLKDLPKGKGVKRHNMKRYRWLVVDVDTLRENKSTSNASDEEKDKSLVVAKAVYAYLRGLGWPPAVFCDSGNGWHLVWKIELDCSVVSQAMLANCLMALAAKFNNDDAEVDETLAEPEQVIKLWGTTVRKGQHSKLRPWRQSRILEMPETIEVVPVELLESLAEEAPVKYTSGQPIVFSKRGGLPEVDDDFDPEDLFEWCQENLPEEYRGFFVRDEEADHDEHDGHHYVMDGCFWSERKHSGDRKKTEFILGDTFGFKCFSDDCADVRIGDILRKVSKLAGKRYPETIWPNNDDAYANVEFLDGDELSMGPETVVVAEIETTEEMSEPMSAEDGKAEDVEVGIEEIEDLDEIPAFVSKMPTLIDSPVEAAVTAAIGDPLAFPNEAMYGKLGQMAEAMNMPLGLAYPALIGTYSVMPELDEMSDTRINGYVILLAAPGGGKNVAIKRALAIIKPPKEAYKKSAPVSDRGVMSLIGHKVERKRGQKEVTPGPRRLLLVTNEAANVLKKANIKNSSLGATLCELWDENEYAPADRNGEQPCNCRLSWIGGLPIKREHPEEFGEYFGRESGRGLLSRTILGFSDAKFNYKQWKVPDVWGHSEDDMLDELGFQHPQEVQLTAECIQMLEEWEPMDEDEAGRFKYNGTKVALLSASANGDKVVSRECMQAALEFAKWQERLREVFTVGVAAENSLEAQFTESLIIALKQKGADTKFVSWRRLAHDRKWEIRFGPRVVNTTVENLIQSGTLEPHKTVEEGEDGKKRVKVDANKVKLHQW